MKDKVQAPAGQGAAKTAGNASRFTPEFDKPKPKKQTRPNWKAKSGPTRKLLSVPRPPAHIPTMHL